MSGQMYPRWPLRFTRTPRDNLRVTYRGVLVAELFRDLEESGGSAEWYPTGTYTGDTNWRRVRRWVRQQAQAMDLHAWWGVHIGAKLTTPGAGHTRAARISRSGGE